MDERQQSQIALIVAHELDLARRGAEAESKAIFAAHSAKGILGGGVTVKVVSSAIGTGSERLLAVLVEKVGAIARTPQAHDQIAAALKQHFANMEGEVVESARMASGRGQAEPHPSILQAAMILFDQIKADIQTKLEIERFAFEVVERTPEQAQSATVTPPPVAKNRGGKPLAAHWDGMWSSIAVELWQGNLQPKTQADLSKAMLEWFSLAEIDIGETAVRKRARELWLKYEAATLDR